MHVGRAKRPRRQPSGPARSRSEQPRRRPRARSCGGRKPKPVSETPEPEAKANFTDPEGRIRETRWGYVQGYNARAVATADQIVVAAEVTQEENDADQRHPMRAAADGLKAAGVEGAVGAVLVDAGYGSEGDWEQADPEGPERFVATRKDWKRREQLWQAPPPRGRTPGHLSRRERRGRKLLRERGRRLYKERSQIIEPMFGRTKASRGDRPVPASWPGELPERVEGDLRDPQPAEAVAGREGLLELKWGRRGRAGLDPTIKGPPAPSTSSASQRSSAFRHN